MRRAMAALFALSLVAGIPPASSGDDHFEGEVLLPIDSPMLARHAFMTDPDLNGVVGFVVDLRRRYVDGTQWTLTETDGIGQRMWIYFYPTIAGLLADPCQLTPEMRSGNVTTGSIVCGDWNDDGVINNADRARWAVVTMLPGFDGRFELDLD